MLSAQRQATAAKSAIIEQLSSNRLNLADNLRLRQMEIMLLQTSQALEHVKIRLDQLEKTVSKHGDDNPVFNPEHQIQSSTPPLPIAEIKQLAEMAKRFK